jgi:hypothetical protein
MPKAPESRLIAVHILKATLIAICAGGIVAFFHPSLASAVRPFADWIGSFGMPGAVILALILFILVGVACPRHFLASVRGLRLFPRHAGIIVRSILGFFVCITLLYVSQVPPEGRAPSMYAITCTLVFCGLGLPAGFWVALFVEKTKTSQLRDIDIPSQADGNMMPSTDLSDEWFLHDRPISAEHENRFPEHINVAHRIVRKLTPSPESIALPNVALVGPYGSGKTTICNLVKAEYEKVHSGEKEVQHALFCRFEAWQYRPPNGSVPTKSAGRPENDGLSAI